VLENFNTHQVCQLTSAEFAQPLPARRLKVQMNSRGRGLDNLFVERLWRTVRFDEVYPQSCRLQIDAYINLEHFFRFYNEQRQHSAFYIAEPKILLEVYRQLVVLAIHQ